jgi:hypothetical protein
MYMPDEKVTLKNVIESSRVGLVTSETCISNLENN